MGDRVSKLDKDTHFYSTRELDEVLGGLDFDVSMREVIMHLKRKRVQFSTEAIRSVGIELGLTCAAVAVIDALNKNRKKSVSVTVANDDDVLTVGQLREAVNETVRGFAQGRWLNSTGVDDFVNEVMQRVNHPWNMGDIVQDAIGNWYKRTGTDQWAIFGNSGYVNDACPVRPLKKMN